MATTWQRGAIFASGLALGAAAAAWLVLARDDGSPASPSSSSSSSATPAAPDTRIAGAAGTTSCAFQPAIAKAGDKDGQASLPAKVDGKPASEAAQLLVTGKEAAAAGRPRDAEVSFLTACRVAESLDKAGELPLAEAKYHLARHYRVVALGSSPGAKRSELLRRADGLYADALATYRDKHGDDHEKTRFAAEGLQDVRQAAGGPAPAPVAAAPKPAPAPAPVVAAAPAPVPAAPAAKPAPRVAAAPQAATPPSVPEVVRSPQVRSAPLPAEPVPSRAATAANAVDEAAREARRQEAERQAQADRAQREARRLERERIAARRDSRPPADAAGAADTPPVMLPPAQATGTITGSVGRTRPSFDCGKARSPTEKMICADEELAQMDRDLGRLHSRARAAAPDQRDFQRRSDREWSEREATCRDRDCLRRWYSERRQELSGEIGGEAIPVQ